MKTRSFIPLYGVVVAIAYSSLSESQASHRVKAETPYDLNLSGSLGAEVTNKYFDKGYRFEDKGVIFQPWLDLQLGRAAQQNRLGISEYGVALSWWGSVHEEDTDARTGSSLSAFYESDYFVGGYLKFGQSVEVKGLWSRSTSPNKGYASTESLRVVVNWDDSEAQGAWAMQPSLMVLHMIHRPARLEGGTYCQLTLTPSVPLDGSDSLKLSFPVVLGLSLDEYYKKSVNGSDHTFGFAKVGVKLTKNLGNLGASWENASVSAGVDFLWLGETPRYFNNEDGFETLYTVGMSWSF